MALSSVVLDEGKPVTFEMLGRTSSISSEAAQSELQRFADKHTEVKPIYLIGGTTKSAAGSKYRTFSLVTAAGLAAAKASLEQVTSEHVYCVQSSIPEDLEQIAIRSMLDADASGATESGSGISLAQPFGKRAAIKTAAIPAGTKSAFASQLKTKKPPATSSTAAAADAKPAAKSNSFFGKKKPASVKKMFNKQEEKKADLEEMEDSDDGGFELRQKKRNRKKKRVNLSDEDASSEDESEKQAKEEAALEEALMEQAKEEQAAVQRKQNEPEVEVEVEAEVEQQPEKAEKKAEKAVGAGQSTLNTSTTSGVKRKKKRQVEKTYMQGKYQVTEMVWEEYTDDEAEEAEAAEPAEKKPKTAAAIFGKKPVATKPKPQAKPAPKKKAPAKQGGIMSFFGKK